MIKIFNLERLEAIKKAQNNIGSYRNYIYDVLQPAIKRGDWDELEQLDIGFTLEGRSLGKIGDNLAWKSLQKFFEPSNLETKTLNFTLNGHVIERNLRNQLKVLLLKMMWLSEREYSYLSLYSTLKDLKKFVIPLLNKGLNSLEFIDAKLLEEWISADTNKIDFGRHTIYSSLNKLVIEKSGLPFTIGLNYTIAPSDFQLKLKETQRFIVVPQRLYYLGLKESEKLIEFLYPLRNELGELSNYLINFHNKLYRGYAKHLVSSYATSSSGQYYWYLSLANKAATAKSKEFQSAFLELETKTEDKVYELLKTYRPQIKSSYHKKFHSNFSISIGNRRTSGFNNAQNLFKELNGGCLWGIMARSGIRADELYNLHTAKGCTTEIISSHPVYVLHANLSKTIQGSQSKQDEFVTTEVGKKAYEILQALHEPFRKLHPNSFRFFHKIEGDFSAIQKHPLSKHYKQWFENTVGSNLVLTNEDIADLKLSDPSQSFEVGETFSFSGHQLRRSFAYYLIGYELLSFPQLKQQFSHVSIAMTRHYGKNASKFQKLRQKRQNLCHSLDKERTNQKAQIFLGIYEKLANKERVAGGKGKEFAKRQLTLSDNILFSDKVNNDMLTLDYWKQLIAAGKRHIHAVAPGVYCTSTACSLRTQVNLIECVDCKNDYIVDAVFAEAKRKEAEINMYYDIEHNELTPQTASESYITITAAERIMNDLGIKFEPVKFPKEVQSLLIPHIGVTT